ncbi:MAG: leucine-rich repeat protein [Bacteroidales bacterium]|nr:leucine-rich repeat protein [Bacteroidales bacterium]
MKKLVKFFAIVIAMVISSNVFSTTVTLSGVTRTSATITITNISNSDAAHIGSGLVAISTNGTKIYKEYSYIDGIYYVIFTGLQPNTTYTVYTAAEISSNELIYGAELRTFTTLTGIKVGNLYYAMISNTTNEAAVIDYEQNARDITIDENITYNGQSYNVTTIADNCFNDCSKLKELTIGKNVSYIGSNAFVGCNSLTYIYCKANIPADLAKYAFEGLTPSNITCTVPCGQKVVYQATPEWKWFKIAEDCGGVGIEDVEEGNVFSVYPNPANEQITIEGKGDITVINNAGQVVKTLNGIRGIKEINVSDLENGVYYIKNGNVTKKVIIEK